ncbi:hypothetical protein Tco_1506888 [Tanacetum coccineum]
MDTIKNLTFPGDLGKWATNVYSLLMEWPWGCDWLQLYFWETWLTHLNQGPRNDFWYKVPSSMTYFLALAFSLHAFPFSSESVAFSRYYFIGVIHVSPSSYIIVITSIPSMDLHGNTSTNPLFDEPSVKSFHTSVIPHLPLLRPLPPGLLPLLVFPLGSQQGLGLILRSWVGELGSTSRAFLPHEPKLKPVSLLGDN